MCIPDLVIIKYFGNNTTEIKRIVLTYPDLLPSTLVVELELIPVYRNKSHLVGQLLNSIHNAQTHVYKIWMM